MMDFFIAHAGVISEAPSVSTILGNILSFLLSIVAVLAILAIVIAGLRYFFVRSEDQAKIAKKNIEIIVIGLLVLFGSVIIISALGRFLQ